MRLMALRKSAFGSTSLRVIRIDGEPWFSAPDSFRALCLDLKSGTHNHLRGLGQDERRLIRHGDHPYFFAGSKASSMTIISESGLYKLIMRSNKPEARQFQDWVTRDVLPAIRKDGAYIQGEEKVALSESEKLSEIFKLGHLAFFPA
jgi:prophage antirepressor-like protein